MNVKVWGVGLRGGAWGCFSFGPTPNPLCALSAHGGRPELKLEERQKKASELFAAVGTDRG